MLREKIARVIEPRPWTGGRENSKLYAGDRRASLKAASNVLALFQDELDKVVDVEELSDLQRRIAEEIK